MRRLAAACAVLLGAVLTAAIWAQGLHVTQSADQVRISAPDLHFLTGKPLERLRNGNSVAFDIQLTALGDGKTSVLQRAFERFVISYDLWEQTYSVSRMRSTRASAAHLNSTQTEAWCLDNMTLSAATLPKDTPLWFRLEVRGQEKRPNDRTFEDDSGVSLAALIDMFSRASRGGRTPDYWRLETGPTRLRAR